LASLKNLDVSLINSWSQSNQVFIDVRSPGEFNQGHIPGAFNAPILDDSERAAVGLIYKRKGNEAAVALGHQIVSGENKLKKIENWKNLLKQFPTAILTCFRGGQRSQITQKWLKEEGFECPLVEGGYKAMRQALIEKTNQMAAHSQFLIVSGPTGAGKTQFLFRTEKDWPTIQLEAYAEHRGSAFGGLGKGQPAQAIFENRLSWDLFKLESRIKNTQLPLLMEDESRLIGRSVIPEAFFLKMRESPVIWLDVPLSQRVEHTFEEYILKEKVNENLFLRYKTSLSNIQKRLGGLKYKEILTVLEECEREWKSRGSLDGNKAWIESLLIHYYDPLYFDSLEKRQPQIFYKGSAEDAWAFLIGQKSSIKEKAVKAKANPT
jgi:tRNA 2-selenouridine synthase